MEENPFPDLKIDSSEFLDSIKGRSKCSACQRSRKYYCYTCYLPVPELSDKVPRVKLPLKVDIIKHPSEVDGKSTAIHAGVIAPDDVTIHTYPVIPDYKDKDRVAVVFPGDGSLTLSQLAAKYNHVGCAKLCDTDLGGKRKRNSSNEIDEYPRKYFRAKDDCNKNKEGEKTSVNESHETVSYTDRDSMEKINGHNSERESCGLTDALKGNGMQGHDHETETVNSKTEDEWFLERVIFIDSTWNQTRSIFGDERLRGLQCIQLSDRKTKFWRHHKDNPDTYLSTIEAIYYFICDYHETFISEKYCAEYDNLLFFFRYMYGKIRHIYDGGQNLLAYKKSTIGKNDCKDSCVEKKGKDITAF